VAGVLLLGLIISNRVRDLDDYFFTIMKIIAWAAIVWYSGRWPPPESGRIQPAERPATAERRPLVVTGVPVERVAQMPFCEG
jgi:hypothetical protein